MCIIKRVIGKDKEKHFQATCPHDAGKIDLEVMQVTAQRGTANLRVE